MGITTGLAVMSSKLCHRRTFITVEMVWMRDDDTDQIHAVYREDTVDKPAAVLVDECLKDVGMKHLSRQ